jgi:hypothetical protein
MKNVLRAVLVFLVLLVLNSTARAEKLQDFLKRTGVGDATIGDLHKNFHMSVFVGGQVFEMNRDGMLKFWEQQKASGIKLSVDSFAILSKTETANDDGEGAVVSVVAKCNVTEDVRGVVAKVESISHFIMLRDPKGGFHLVYAVVPKQVRSVGK